ncbi:MAG TPA: phosphoribosylanthranilate isomerase [Dehalococcoidia bacterium]|jgi:phosphoribosylanthranilate isomerase|nr:N-(5'-phosphoribosyl)anthranilate isomerase [Chloroflexota bacterium]MDP5877639.1 phosphoribosylanthranilate isomerase [Dehalococcoidia bacterium]MDP6272538.1 phosphoribosylanthranilate isomerase [Dehalococcoidia bacterium]MDP7159680.1 phosphoribosylanthranilate isomerase [Dehalococcoidia bacterium]MDP7212860.1 phosphoribosylanthranilate isomerase [Dehalococcoidia bacterium]|tara:strand:- start:4005 stop:4661 length:657 start_codon:yes stop_codon:yes gene_type:complete
MPIPHVKICGLRDAQNAQAATLAGADFVGFNFVDGVRRQLEPMIGATIISAFRNSLSEDSMPGPRVVGLFRNQPVEFVNRVVRMAALDMVQLCGDEDDDYYAQMERPILKQLRVRSETSAEDIDAEVKAHLAAGRMVVLDAYDPNTPGGTGKVFEWSKAANVAPLEGVLLAGGLTPDNVSDAIRELGAWGVDVSSGVETDGDKDDVKMHNFITEALGA